MKTIPLATISTDALIESQQKWALGLLYGWWGSTMLWSRCSICNEVDKYAEKKPPDTYNCSDYCPLSPSSWCRSNVFKSKLCIYEQKIEEWETHVSNYLWWIDLEIEAREHYEVESSVPPNNHKM